MKRNKKGISLIVFVITIIVMIILAAAVILAIVNSGIIQSSKDAVNTTNLKQVQELASLGWTEAFFKPITGTKDDTYYQTEVINYLKANGLTDKQLGKYTITATTGGVTVRPNESENDSSESTPEINENEFYFDQMYVATTSIAGATNIGYVFHADGTAEQYTEVSDTLFCTGTIGGVTYSNKQATIVVDEMELTFTFSDAGRTVSASSGEITVTGECSFQEIHGLYRGYIYTGTSDALMNGEVIGTNMISVSFETEDDVATLESTVMDLDDNIINESTQSAEFSIMGNEHIVTSSGFELFVSADGRKLYFVEEHIIFTIAGIQTPDDSTEGSVSNDYEDKEWEVAWIYENGAWSQPIKEGTVSGDIVVKLYPTGEPVTPTSVDSESMLGQFAATLEPGSGYAMVVEGSGNMPALYTKSESGTEEFFAWQKYSIAGIFGGASQNDEGIDKYYPFYITETIICDGIYSIGENCFYGFMSLEDIKISSTVRTIEQNAFMLCEGMESISLPNSITKIGDDAFAQCLSLEDITIPESATNLGGSVFSSCVNLTSVNLPSKLTSIPSYMFENCEKLATLTIPSGVNEIGEGAFEESGISSLTIPNNVTTIGNRAFADCGALTNITIPNGVTSVGEELFMSCDKLDTVTLNCSIDTIPVEMFRGCTSLNNIAIPTTVTKIGASSFYGCTSLESIIIPANVSEIGNYSFGNSTSLKAVTFKQTTSFTVNYSSFNNIASGATFFVQSDSMKQWMQSSSGMNLENITVELE